uniref:DUF3823 domain-containing protein n=1 Tax=uncultured Draconibacterium sp. TaxID=1573823 RepID=UPI00321787C5
MKDKILKYSLIGFLLISLSSCLEIDNYDGPQETVLGKIVDKQGRPVYANTGKSSVRIKMLDYGYSETPSEYYLNVKTDGTYINEKIFESNYTMIPEGPFVPNEGQENIFIRENTEVNFEVEPFFVVEWREPALVPNSDGTVTANIRITRGTDNPDYQEDLNQVFIFISTTQYVGSNQYDQRVSAVVSGSDAKNLLNIDASVSSKTSGSGESLVKLKSGYTYYVRVGVRSNMDGIIAGAYNLSAVKKLVMP